MVSKILIAFDGSDPSRRALRTALEIGRALNADIHAIYVFKPGDVAGLHSRVLRSGIRRDPTLERYARTIREEDAKMEKQIADIAAEFSTPVRTHRKIGDPREEIQHFAGIVGADLIVLGARGKGGIGQMLLGSVSSHVVRHSTVSTLVVR